MDYLRKFMVAVKNYLVMVSDEFEASESYTSLFKSRY